MIKINQQQKSNFTFNDLQIILNQIFKQEENFDALNIIPKLLENFKQHKDYKNCKILIDIFYALGVLCPKQVEKYRNAIQKQLQQFENSQNKVLRDCAQMTFEIISKIQVHNNANKIQSEKNSDFLKNLTKSQLIQYFSKEGNKNEIEENRSNISNFTNMYLDQFQLDNEVSQLSMTQSQINEFKISDQEGLFKNISQVIEQQNKIIQYFQQSENQYKNEIQQLKQRVYLCENEIQQLKQNDESNDKFELKKSIFNSQDKNYQSQQNLSEKNNLKQNIDIKSLAEKYSQSQQRRQNSTNAKSLQNSKNSLSNKDIQTEVTDFSKSLQQSQGVKLLQQLDIKIKTIDALNIVLKQDNLFFLTKFLKNSKDQFIQNLDQFQFEQLIQKLKHLLLYEQHVEIGLKWINACVQYRFQEFSKSYLNSLLIALQSLDKSKLGQNYQIYKQLISQISISLDKL